MVGRNDDVTGQAIAAFVTLRAGNDAERRARPSEIRDHVAQGHRADRQAQDDPLHRRPAEDPVGQDHAPPPAQRRGGRRARRHHDAGRPRRRGVDQAAVPHRLDRRRGRRHQHPCARPRRSRPHIPTTGPGARQPVVPGPAVVVDIDGVLSDAAGRQPPGAPRPRLGRVLRRGGRRPRHRGDDARCSTCSTPRCRSAC